MLLGRTIHLRLVLGLISALAAAILPWCLPLFREGVGLVLPILLIVAAGIFGSSSVRNMERNEVFGQRERLKLDQIYSQFYSTSGISPSEFEQAWIAIAQTLQVAPSVLRPSDRFGFEIKASWSIDSEIDALEALCRRNIPNFDANKNAAELRNIDEVLRALAKKDRNQAVAGTGK